MDVRWFARMVAAVLLRPGLWCVALRQANRLAARGWWRRPPFLPVPARNHAAFRATTQYGDPTAAPSIDDVLVWLRWARRFPG